MYIQTDRNSGLKPPNYCRFDKSRHQHHLRVPETVSKHFQSLRDKFHRLRSSSMYSIRAEFPPPPDGRERRILSRNSADIWPSSGEESPIFNTPESNVTPMAAEVPHADSLAASGLQLATAELDRLTTSAQGSRPRTSATSFERSRFSSGTGSAQSESDSSMPNTIPGGLARSPTSSVSSSGAPSPTARSPHGSEHRSRRQHSRLSEVTTPDEFNTPLQRSDEGGNLVSPRALSPSPEAPHISFQSMEAERDETLVPRPLSISRPSSADDRMTGDASPTAVSVSSRTAPIYNRVATGLPMEASILLPRRPSSREQTPDLIYAIANRAVPIKILAKPYRPDT